MRVHGSLICVHTVDLSLSSVPVRYYTTVKESNPSGLDPGSPRSNCLLTHLAMTKTAMNDIEA
eukprot:IDg10029t1